MGIRVTITEALIAKVIGARSNGMFMVNTGKTRDWVSKIYLTMHEGRESQKAIHIENEYRMLHKLTLMCFMPREGGTTYMSWDHKHFLYLFINKYPINLPAYIFNYLCTSIRDGIKGRKEYALYKTSI